MFFFVFFMSLSSLQFPFASSCSVGKACLVWCVEVRIEGSCDRAMLPKTSSAMVGFLGCYVGRHVELGTR
jgi:hypothetical protein